MACKSSSEGQHAVAAALLGAAWLQAGAQLSAEQRLAVTAHVTQCLSSIGAALPASRGSMFLRLWLVQVDINCVV